MRILINCSNLVVGGGIQVASSVITELKRISGHFFVIALSREMSSQIEINDFSSNFKFFHLQDSPAVFSKRIAICNKLNQIESQENIDFVITIFGPSYWRPKKAKHLCGFALPWMIYPESIAYEKLGWKQKFKTKLLNWYKLYHFKKECDFYWCETDIVKERMIKVLNLSNICVIGNTVSHHFDNFERHSSLDVKDDVFKLLTVSAYYSHKNLEIIKEIIPFIKKSNQKIKFYLTLPELIFNELFKTKDELKYVENLGVISNKDCPRYYQKVNAVFLPTLLECFSANYIEAMCTSNPIITSNLDFARLVCKDAAIYFNPQDPEEAFNKISTLKDDDDLIRKMIVSGKEIFLKQKTPSQRARDLIQICENNYKN